MSEQPLLQITDLSVSFHQNGQIVEAVKQINLSLGSQQTLALVGESGSGKSVTAYSILQLLPYPQAFHPGGSIRFKGQELLGATPAQLRKIRGDQIGMIFQEPMMALNPLHTLEKQISESLIIHQGMTQKQARARVLELLNLVGIKDPQTRLSAYPNQLSGGQRQRVMIAMALANEPELLIADEPTTALDVTIQAQILDLLKSLQERLHMSILLITHDLGIVEHYADQVAVMHNGQLVETNTVTQLFRTPQHAYTQKLLNAQPHGEPVPLPQTPANLARINHLKVWFPIHAGLFKRIKDHFKAVDDISFVIQSGETLGIVGESGSGKSTLAFAVLRLLSSQGEIFFNGEPLHLLNQKQLRPVRKFIQVVFQDPFASLSPRMPVSAIVAEGLKLHFPKLMPTEVDERVCQALSEVGIEPTMRHRYPHEFSGGQRQRIAIARAMILKPKLVILDEPTSALDRSVQSQILDLLKSLQEKHGLSYLFISHDLKVIKSISHRVLVMRQGVIVEHGQASRIFEQPQSDYTKALLAAAL